jgi:DNA-binding IclR family transcriptional regulator
VANSADEYEEVAEGAPGRATVKSADRVLTLFELLGRWGCEMSHTEIADLMGIPKSSLSQLLRNLVGRGWLGYSPGTRKYVLGPAIIDLARGAAQVQDAAALSGPVLAELAAATNETAALNVLRGDLAETVATALGGETLLAVMRLGQRSPLYTTSYGKVLLAYLPDDMQEDYLRRVKLAPVTPQSIVSLKQLRAQLQTIRRDGVAYSFEEQVQGIVGTARPVFAPNGNVLGAISIASAAIRYDKRLGAQISQAIAQAVTKLSQQLRHLRSVPEGPPARRGERMREKV